VQGDEWGVLKLGAVTWGVYDASENKALPATIDSDPGIEVHAGDLLFVRKNTYELVGACALVRQTPPRLMMSDLMFRLVLRPGQVNAFYLQQLLAVPTKRRELQRLAGGSAGSMPNISKGRLANQAVELPPLDLQNAFESRATRVETLRSAHLADSRELEALFASLQHRAFLGEL